MPSQDMMRIKSHCIWSEIRQDTEIDEGPGTEALLSKVCGIEGRPQQNSWLTT